MERGVSLLGLVAILGVSCLLSRDRKKIRWRTVGFGIGLQLLFGLITLKSAIGQGFFSWVRDLFVALMNFSNDGGSFVFGNLTKVDQFGFIFAFQVAPTIIFMSALMGVLYHLGIMQWIVKGMAKIMVKVMGTSGAESLSAAANVFVGQTEAPLVIRPFLADMTKSELMAMMTGGLATVAGGVLVAYVGMGMDAAHLLTASVISAPAALVCAKMLVPEVGSPETLGKIKMELPKTSVNVIDAAMQGTRDGLSLALNVAAMLMAFLALVALANGILGWAGGLLDFPELSLELIAGYLFSPIAWLMGVPWEDCRAVGILLGKKLVLNEFVAYLDLKERMATMNPRSVVIATYALCGFANFGSIAIIVGGVGSLIPSRRKDLAELGLVALIAGTMACLMTGCIAGLLI